jgi:ClpP class serine protease
MMTNKPGLIARLFGRSQNSVVARLYSHGLDTPLCLHPRIGERLMGAYLDGAVETQESVVAKAGTIAIINVSGGMVNRPMPDVCGDGPLSYTDVRLAFDSALYDASISAIILRLDTPGGMAAGLFDLTDYIFASRGIKPIVAQIDDMAYSGGYAIAAACDSVQISRTGGVGSIGVVCYHVDQSGYDKQQGFEIKYVYSGAHKIDGNPHEPLPPGVEADMQVEVDTLRDLFVGSLTRYLGVDEKVIYDTEALCYMGQLAINAGLAHTMGTLEDLIARLSTPETPAVPAQETQNMNDDDNARRASAAAPAAPAEPAKEVPDNEPDAVSLKVTGYPSPVRPGTANDFTVTAIDNKGAVDNDYTGIVHFASSDSEATLPGKGPLTKGVGVFSATLKTTGKQSITATDTVTSSITGHQAGIEVEAAAAAAPPAPATPPATSAEAAKAALSTALAASKLPPALVVAMLRSTNEVVVDQIGARIAAAGAISDLCCAAHLESCAADFVTRGCSVEQARAELSGAVADTSDELVTVIPEGGKKPAANKLDPAAIYAELNARNNKGRAAKSAA